MSYFRRKPVKWLLKKCLLRMGLAFTISATTVISCMARKPVTTPAAWSFTMDTDRMTGNHYCKARYPVGPSYLEIFPQENVPGGKAMLGATIPNVPGLFEITRWKIDNGPVKYAPPIGILFDYQDLGGPNGIDALSTAIRIKIEYYDGSLNAPEPRHLDFLLADFSKALARMRSQNCQQ